VDADAVDSFAARYPFGLDPFQRQACEALAEGHGVLVAAPTGAGKTVVGEFAVWIALGRGTKCFYTTPIKALSNQKYADLVALHGEDNVGLLTGDTARNGDAPVVVMTTEVLRNMLYAGSDALRGLSHVVMDEVHYLADRFRGAVWEEVIIHLPAEVRLVSLSATVSNAEEFGEWLVTVRGDTRVVVEEHRPVPLWQHVLAGPRLYDLFVDHSAPPDAPTAALERAVNPELTRLVDRERRGPGSLRQVSGRRAPGGARSGPPRRTWVPSRPEVIDRLDRAGLLPAITFIFSRAGCDAAVEACLRSGVRLTTPAERDQVRAHVRERTNDLPEPDLRVLGYWEWAEGLERGVAAHHAGLLPRFKEVTEELFAASLVKAVFATETLALGINMPARSVVLERLTKWNGETHADVTPGEYTQLTGRAGRRGIDVEGHAVVLYQSGLDPVALAGLASTRTYPLRSSFRPSYNMAVNLVGSVGRERARALLESSFAQFQADRAVVGLARQIRRNLTALEGYAEAMTCHLGSAAEYAELRRRLSERESALAREGAASRRRDASDSVARLRVGDVVRVPRGKGAGLAVTLSPGGEVTDSGRLVVLTDAGQVKRLTLLDFPTEVEPVGRVKVPKSFNARVPASRRDLLSSLRALDLPATSGGRGPRSRSQEAAADEDGDIARLRRELRAHPVHGCSDREDHQRWAERYDRLRRETTNLERRVENRTSSIARTFDRVCALLEERGYLHDETVTAEGRRLARVYTEADLLVAECLRTGTWDALDAPGLAAVVSCLVYSSRRDDAPTPRLPGGPLVRDALAATVRRWAELSEAEAAHRLSFLPEPDAGFAWAAQAWAAGSALDLVLGEQLSAGDFVRWTRQLIDLLDQIAGVADEPVRRTARRAVTGLRRGVVAYTA